MSYLHLDGGMADNLRPALYGARYEAAVATRMNAEQTHRVHIAGRYCESSDVMIDDVMMPWTKPGDIVVMPGCCAYTISMASNYNLTRRRRDPSATVRRASCSAGKPTRVCSEGTLGCCPPKRAHADCPAEPDR